MSLNLTEEQDELARGARAFVREHLPIAHLRKLRDQKLPVSREIWGKAAELGWAGIAIGEKEGGAGLGMAEVGVVMEELGRTLAPTPMLATAVLGAALAPPAILRAVAAGKELLAVAFEERDRFAPDVCETRMSGGKLTGTKRFVLDGNVADHLLVGAQDGVYRVAPADAQIEPLAMVDSRGVARVRFEGAPAEKVATGPDLSRAIDRATGALAAEMLGGASEVFTRTIEYLKQRKQFGVPIGSFQALKHRAAQIFCELELTRSIVRAALVALDASAPDAPALVSAAKARASDTFVLASAEAVQMHGGIGVTDELDIGFYYKRARVAELTFGSAAYHRERYAALHRF